MSQEKKTVSYPYPNELYDQDGYPTKEALDYVKNWSYEFVDKEVVWGQYAITDDYTLLIDYLKEIWACKDGVIYEDGLLEIHTLGWSGNEEIISILETTTLWTFKKVAHQTGGHYYFRVDDNSKQTWQVQKVDSKW